MVMDVFQNSNFCLKTKILSLATSYQLFSLMTQSHFFLFWENVYQMHNSEQPQCLPTLLSRKTGFPWEKWLVPQLSRTASSLCLLFPPTEGLWLLYQGHSSAPWRLFLGWAQWRTEWWPARYGTIALACAKVTAASFTVTSARGPQMPAERIRPTTRGHYYETGFALTALSNGLGDPEVQEIYFQNCQKGYF